MTLNIWRFTDGKPGHDSQSTGLCLAIEKLKPSQRFDVHIEPSLKNLNHFLFKRFPAGKNLPEPDLIIGAGHGTHLPMLNARRARSGKIIVLMKPSLPSVFFDICIIPEHDQAPIKNNIINTVGALNPIAFNENKTTNKGLILVGGPSKHYLWNDNAILNQVEHILAENPGLDWTVGNSPRTPETFYTELQKRALKNIQIAPYTKTNSTELRKLIYDSSTIWVTQDSVSMIYESLSSGAGVGLIELRSNRVSRIERGINRLINENKLTGYSEWKNKHTLSSDPTKFNEAERCAKILLEKGILN